jgi:5-formyltetrahydrofolate cyclo-ligase
VLESQEMMQQKKEIRKLMRRVLQAMGENTIFQLSQLCQDKVLQSPMYLNSRGICCYLSMTNELQTNKLIESSLSDSKLVYIPKVIGSNATDMQIHQIHSLEQVKSFPKSSWGIPEPPDDALCSNDYAQSVDVVFLPGVAFDRSCRRLGHGKGYYGLQPSFSLFQSQ